MKIEIRSAFILSLPHPIASAVIMALVGPSTLLGAKGGGVGLIYDIPAWSFLVMNLPGFLLTRGWWPESMIYPPVWQVVYCSTLIILNWIFWASITYGVLRKVAARMDPGFEQGAVGNEGHHGAD